MTQGLPYRDLNLDGRHFLSSSLSLLFAIIIMSSSLPAYHRIRLEELTEEAEQQRKIREQEPRIPWIVLWSYFPAREAIVLTAFVAFGVGMGIGASVVAIVWSAA